MSSKSKISVIEKISSLTVIVVLILVLFLVLHFQSHFNPASLGLASIPGENSGLQEKTPFDLKDIIPQGWQLLGRLESYDRDNLYEKIDGKASLYLDSGFLRLYTQKIVDSAEQKNWAEIYVYDMENPQNAFSVFSVQRRSNAVSIEDVAVGYCADNAAFAAIGRYYLDIIGSNISPETVAAVKSSVLNFNQASGGAPSVEASFAKFFPAENLLADTLSLSKSDTFGFELFKDTYIGHYSIEGKSLTAFVIVCSDAAKASQLDNAYRKFLSTNGLKRIGTESNISADIYEYDGLYEIVFSAGKYVGGVHEAADRALAERLALKMKQNFEKDPVDGGK